MNHASNNPSFCAGDIEPSRRQFIELMFPETFRGNGPADARREQLMGLVHQRLFVESASVAEVRQEIENGLRQTRVFAVTSGKGGVGKTTVSVNLAVAFAKRGLRVLLFDADFGMANTHIFAGVNPTATLADVLSGRITLGEAVVPGPVGIDVICGASGVGWLADLRPTQLESLGRDLLAVAADYDVLLLDTGAGISAAVMQFLGLAGDIIVVSTPNLAATLDAYGIIKLARESCRAARLHLIVNQSDNQKDAAQAAERITTCASRFLHYTPASLGWLRRDRAVEQANQSRVPLLLSQPSHVNAVRITQFASMLLAGRVEAAETAAA
jgi:flagellar biosynthesis protein FlhG